MKELLSVALFLSNYRRQQGLLMPIQATFIKLTCYAEQYYTIFIKQQTPGFALFYGAVGFWHKNRHEDGR